MNKMQLLAKIKNKIIDDTTIVSNSVAIQILTSDMLIESIGWKAITKNLKE